MAAVLLLLTIIGISGGTDREARGASFANTQAKLVASANDPGVGPVAGWVDDVLALIDRLRRTLQDAEEEAEEGQINATSGTRGQRLPNPNWLAIYLDSAEADIDHIFDGYQYPSLTPVDAGDVDPTVFPLTLSEHASTCVELAQQAFDEVLIGPAPDHEVVGTKLKTIKALLPDYRALAGIE